MSAQPGNSISPPPPASSGNSGSGVRRHHTISASSRINRPASKAQAQEVEDEEQEQVWDQDEIVDQDWRGGIGAVGEKSSLHRQASLPTRYHRAFGGRGQGGGPNARPPVNSLSAIAGHEGEEEEWENEMRGFRNEDDHPLSSSDHGHQDSAASPLSAHFAGVPGVPSPPPGQGGAGVRRHQSLNYPNAGGVRRLNAGLKRAGTLQAPPIKGQLQQGMYSGAQSPSPTGAEEEYEYDDESVRSQEDGYFRVPAQQSQGQYPTSPIGRSSPWNTPGAGNDWRTQIGGNNSANMGPGGIDDVTRALSTLELNQQYANQTQGGYPQGLRNGAPAGSTTNRKLQLVTDLDAQMQQSGIQSASAYVPPIGHGMQQNQGQRRGDAEEPQLHQRERSFTASGSSPWDQKLGSRVSNSSLNNTFNAQAGKNASIPNVPPIPPQYLNQHGQAPRLAMAQNTGNNQGGQSGRASAQGSTHSPPLEGFITSPIDVPTLIATKGYNPPEFDTRPAFARYFVIKSYTEDDVHKSLKYEIWSSTDPGNKRLDKAFKETAGRGPIYLFFSVNASGHFCGMAEMLTPVDYTRSSTVWASDKWKGVFKVRWIFVRDIPNASLRHIKLNNTQERKPVTNSRDTQELLPEAGQEMLRIFHTHPARTSLLQDFAFYELQAMQKAQAVQTQMQSGPSSPEQTNSSMQPSASQSPVLSPSVAPAQHPFAMSNPTALAYAAQMGMSPMNMAAMGMGMGINPMLQMQMNLNSLNSMSGMGSMAGMAGMGTPFPNPTMQSVMRHPSPGPMQAGSRNYMGMGNMPGF